MSTLLLVLGLVLVAIGVVVSLSAQSATARGGAERRPRGAPLTPEMRRRYLLGLPLEGAGIALIIASFLVG